jgi:hypothetical protein
MALFSPERTLLLKYEMLRDQPDHTMEIICNFLGVGRHIQQYSGDVHTLPYESMMSEREKEFLSKLYEHEIRQLERMLGWECREWIIA